MLESTVLLVMMEVLLVEVVSFLGVTVVLEVVTKAGVTVVLTFVVLIFVATGDRAEVGFSALVVTFSDVLVDVPEVMV